MKTQVSSGEVINFTAPVGGTVSGRGEKIGGFLLIAKTSNNAGDIVAGQRVGEIDHAAEGAGSGQAWAFGDTVYWDATNKRFTKTAASNTAAGYASAAKDTAATLGRLVLVPGL